MLLSSTCHPGSITAWVMSAYQMLFRLSLCAPWILCNMWKLGVPTGWAAFDLGWSVLCCLIKNLGLDLWCSLTGKTPWSCLESLLGSRYDCRLHCCSEAWHIDLLCNSCYYWHNSTGQEPVLVGFSSLGGIEPSVPLETLFQVGPLQDQWDAVCAFWTHKLLIAGITWLQPCHLS